MNHLIIKVILGNKTVEDFTIPVTNMEECLFAADVAYREAMTYLRSQRGKTMERAPSRKTTPCWNGTHVGGKP
jgi:hypothetical protein